MSRRSVPLFVVLVALSLAPPAARGAETFVWLESERPTRANVELKTDAWAGDPRLSGQKWLQVSASAEEIARKWPTQGGLLEYDFKVAQAGGYEAWDRIGLEGARSPFAWRIDQGAWQTITPDRLTCDLVELGFWCEVAWIKLGDVELAAGNHTVQIRPLPAMKEEKQKKRGADGKEVEVVVKTPEKIMYASDCLCLHRGQFRPNGRFQPGEDWQTADDGKAAKVVFDIPQAPLYPPGTDPGVMPPEERIKTSLAGLWQVCRFDEQEVTDRVGPTKTLPDAAAARWMSIPVPGNKFEVKPELRFCHRFVYRTRIDVPAGLAGRSFVLQFPSLSLMASVHVNGQFCGWTKAPFAEWACDVTRAIRPGQVNEVCVVVKDSYYAFNEKKSGKSCRLSFNVPVAWMGTQNWINQFFDFPIGSDFGGKSGILLAPSLVVAGGVYTSDVFVQPSVRKKQLGLELTLVNSSPQARTVQVRSEIVPAAGGKAEKTLAPRQVTLPAGSEAVIKLAETWENPRLWWPDDPALYQLSTTIVLDGRPIDVRRTAFGFREWEWSGRQFKLNGVPWQLWADCTLGDGGKDPEAAVAQWQANGQNTWRFWGQQFGGLDKQKALDLMDARGIIVRRSGIFDGEGANYLHQLANGRELFDNWIEQLKAWVKEERNHPSILIWSIENEITFINSRNLGIHKEVEPHIARAARAVMALDPTRPAMVDGGNCLLDESLPVNGVHYQESFWRDYPDEAYTLAKAYVAHEKPVISWGKVLWRLVPDRPIYMGESYFVRGSNPAAFSQFAGEGCFTGWGPATQQGAGLLAKMLAEGYRWHGVAAQHFWLGSEDATLHYNSWKPVCVLCRQWNWTFGGGSTVTRTLKVCNDTHYGDPIEMGWELRLDDKPVAGQKRTFQLGPGQHEEVQVSCPVPPVSKRTAGQFILTCSRQGKEVFREVKSVAVIDPGAGPKPSLAASQLAVIDPQGSAKARLRSRGIAFTEAKGLSDVPAQCRVVLVGNGALSARDATDPRWLALAARGARVLALEQEHPLHFQALPADLAPTDYVGRVAFLENPEHPAFAGLAQADFFTWSGDHVVYRNVYKKATRGAISLAHCDEQLGCSAIAECPVNAGLMVLCQMAVGEKLATDPVAQRLFDNLLSYCERYALVEKSTAVAMDPKGPAAKLLADAGLKFDAAGDVLAALADGKHQIVVFEATPLNLKALAAAPDRVKAFTAGGGWLMAWGLTPDGLADFNRLVGVEHLIRPFELERVNLPAVRDPILSGLTVRDVTMESGEQMFPWAGDKYLVDDEFTYVVDLNDIAPFCEFPGTKAGDMAAAKAAGPGWARNVVNGFTSADGWKLIHYMDTKSPTVAMKLPRAETVDALSIVLNVHYAVATKIHVLFDDDPDPLVLVTKPNAERQDFPIGPRKCRRLSVRLAEFNKVDKTTGIDNLWVHVQRPADWPQRVRPLLSMGGLVKYPMGAGGLILNQIRAKPSEAVPVNAQKKQVIAATLLRNLHATFAGGRILTATNLKFHPLPLEERCNQYLTKDRGWFDGGRDLAHLPIGKQDFCGVSYLIRDFRTSPLPSCVMLAGPGARGQLPPAVKGLKAGCKADVLYFLHAFNRTGEWRRGQPEEPAPMLFKYVVHYADAQTADVPVLYGEGADHWIAKEPAGLTGAALAWAAPLPGEKSDEQAVLYQLSWTNPRPKVTIESIDMLYGPAGSQYGTPALLAVTAAEEAK
ncbi:MAG: glycoside hydrolase family 2 TIM barrel-domain containing protein [Thermoguttaceae bacterium]|jgi:beta-galactosidase